MLVALSLLALAVAERRLDNSKEIREPRDGHIEEHRPKKLFGKLKRQKSQYGPPKVHHHPKKPKYGPPPVIYGPPQHVVYGPPTQAYGAPSQAYGNPKPIHPQANYGTPPYLHHSPQAVAYNRPGPVYSQPGPPQSNYRPPAYSGPPQVVYNRPDPVYPRPAPSPPVYVQPVATYSQPAPPEHYNPPQVHATKPEVPYSPPAPSYNPPQVQATQPAYHQPAQSYVAPEHNDSHEDDRKPSKDLPLTSGYNVPQSAHVELPSAVYIAPAQQHYEQGPKPVVNQQPTEQLPETPVYEPPSSAYGSSQPENNTPVLEDDPPKQTAYIAHRPSYTSYDVSTVAPSVSGAPDSSSYANGDDDKFSSSNESDFPSLFDPSSNFYKQSDNAPDAHDDFGFFQIGVFPKTGSFFEQNYKG